VELRGRWSMQNKGGQHESVDKLHKNTELCKTEIQLSQRDFVYSFILCTDGLSSTHVALWNNAGISRFLVLEPLPPQIKQRCRGILFPFPPPSSLLSASPGCSRAGPNFSHRKTRKYSISTARIEPDFKKEILQRTGEESSVESPSSLPSFHTI
jgi:hypothetical protein